MTIGDNCLTAANLIQDVPVITYEDYSSRNNYSNQSVISIGNDVWLGAQSIILQGSLLADGSVVGMKALLIDASIGRGCLCAGNPAMRAIPIEKIQYIKKVKNEGI